MRSRFRAGTPICSCHSFEGLRMSPNALSFAPRHRFLLGGGILLALLIVVSAVVAVRLTKHQQDVNLPADKKWAGRGTTRNLQEIVLGRCYDYVRTVNPGIGEKNCSQIWEKFKNIFVYKNPCSIMKEDYQHLLDLTSHPLPCNKSVFWSKTNNLVHQYAKVSPNVFTLEDTILGYLADGLSWCGQRSSPGINYQSCPSWRECESNPVSSFWKMASEFFAKASCGVVRVMLNGSLPGGAVTKNSLFRSIEVPHLNSNKISEVRVWVMDDIGGPDSESCDGHSVTELENHLKERNFKYFCFDNYRPIHLLQCVQNPDHVDCKSCSTST